MNRREHAHHPDVIYSSKTTQDPFCKQLLTNEAGRDVLNGYSCIRTEDSEKAAQGHVLTNSPYNGNTKLTLYVQYDVRSSLHYDVHGYQEPCL